MQFERSTLVSLSHVEGSEWGDSTTRVALTSILLDSPMQEQEESQFPSLSSRHSSHPSLHIPTGLCSGPRFPDTGPYSTPVNQVNSDLVRVEHHCSTFLECDLSFDLKNSDSVFTSLDPTQGGIPCIFPGLEDGLGFAFNEDPAMNDVPRTSDEMLGYSSSAFSSTALCATNPNPQTSSLGQDMEESFQSTNPYTFPSVDIPPPDLGTDQPAARFSLENHFTSNLADPAAGIHSSLYPGSGESFQVVGYEVVQGPSYTASTPIDQQVILSARPAGLCEWKDENGVVCGEVLTRANLPEHLSTHGIKNMSRDHRTKCNWVGCRRKQPINRESIVRHIREVHLRLKRPPKRAQDPYL